MSRVGAALQLAKLLRCGKNERCLGLDSKTFTLPDTFRDRASQRDATLLTFSVSSLTPSPIHPKDKHVLGIIKKNLIYHILYTGCDKNVVKCSILGIGDPT